MGGHRTTVIVVLTIMAIAVGTSAIAAGRGANASSVTLKRLDQTTGAATTAALSFGEQVTFEVVTSQTSKPWVLNECFQGGTRVSAEIHGFFDGYLFGEIYSLGPTDLWSSGSADCTAKLLSDDHNKTKVLATTSYHVNG